jgi:hypothetical protein
VRIRDLLFAIYVVICAAALTQPGYALFGNRVEPFVLGLPFVLVWSVGWIALTFVVLALYHATDRRG